MNIGKTINKYFDINLLKSFDEQIRNIDVKFNYGINFKDVSTSQGNFVQFDSSSHMDKTNILYHYKIDP
jgi:hypothetical protein